MFSAFYLPVFRQPRTAPCSQKSANSAGAYGRKDGGHRFRNHLDFLKIYVLGGVTSLRFLAGGVLEVFVDTLDVVQADISGFKLVKN